MEVTYFDDERGKLLRDLKGWRDRTREEIDGLRNSELYPEAHITALVESLERAVQQADAAIAAEEARAAAQPSRRD